MPLYDYQCNEHGVFEHFNPMSKSGEPCACPDCGVSSPRLISAPFFKLLSPVVRNAMERNEKSRQEPHVCRTGCHHHTHKSKPSPKNPDGTPALQSNKGSRPWVIEHA
ncbi:MAG: zinc ribbon domain-containing protein [Akkermansiaceae bacterium]